MKFYYSKLTDEVYDILEMEDLYNDLCEDDPFYEDNYPSFEEWLLTNEFIVEEGTEEWYQLIEDGIIVFD